MWYILFIMAFVLITIWRITFVNRLIKEWNFNFDSYMFDMQYIKECSPEYLKFLGKFKLKARSYYFRLDVWGLEHIINDPFILQDVLSRIKR